MSFLLLDRLRRALAPDYEVERELSSGGMATVFLGRDRILDRPVAIKILRPELATAEAAERFLREARILASLSHPKIVPVHRAGEADGLFYYVMEHVKGETLAERLARGPLRPAEALRLGRDLLEGLAAAHRAGIVHRDIKPSNVFLVEGRALLADFGIAKPLKERPPVTGPEVPVGTPGYMPPEQALGGEVTPRTDLYAVGMLLYEAFTGRRWSILTSPDHADWSGVPRRVARVLRRALAWSPDDRWPDATAFHRALWATRTRAYVQRTIGFAAAAFLVGGAGVHFLRPVFDNWIGCRRPRPGVLAILPFDVLGEPEGSLGRDLARLVWQNLGGLPRLPLTPIDDAFCWWDDVRERSGSTAVGMGELRRLRARYRTQGTVLRGADSLEVRLAVFDAKDRPLPGQVVARRSARDVPALADTIAAEILSILEPELKPLSRDVRALREFLLGEDAFQRNAWRRAVRHYEAAVEHDSGFALARLRMATAWAWLGLGARIWTQYPGLDFQHLYATHRERLSELDRLLIEAQLTPPGKPRFQKYEEVSERFPRDAYVAFVYGDELFSRGPLVGVPLTQAVSVLSEAAAWDSFLSPAYSLLALGLIRLGRREEGARVIARLKQVAGPPEEVEIYLPPFLEQAYAERFEAERARARRAELFGGVSSNALRALAFASRWPLWLDLPETQLEFGAQLVELVGTADPLARANGHEVQGLALVALGRISEALQHFDSAAALFGSPEAALEAAEWRVIPRALGLPGAPDFEVAAARERLERWVSNARLGPRAAWALALHALAVGDTLATVRWKQRLREASADSAAQQLDRLLHAEQEATRRRYRSALERSEPLLSYYMLKKEDPFARAALHIRRGEWRRRLGDLPGADAEWLWYENFDLVGYPSGEAQAAEVDWAMATYARFLRGRVALEASDNEVACAHLTRVLELWADADPAVAALVGDARGAAQRACRE